MLLNNIEDLSQAVEYAEIVNNPEVWSKMGNAYLGKSLVVEAIDSYIKAKDPAAYL